MNKQLPCIALATMFSASAIAEEKMFVYTDRLAPSLSLASFCAAERIESAEAAGYSDVMRELRSEADEAARTTGFQRGGTCYYPQPEAYGEMYTLLFTMGSHVLYLTSAEIAQFREYKKSVGREGDVIMTSVSWPPSD